MTGDGLSILLFAIGISRRSYTALAVPVFAGLLTTASIAFWIGCTMKTTNWDNPDDFDSAKTANY